MTTALPFVPPSGTVRAPGAAVSIGAAVTLTIALAAWKLGVFPRPNPPTLVSVTVFAPLHTIATWWLWRAARTADERDPVAATLWRWLAASEFGMIATNIAWYVSEAMLNIALGVTWLDLLPVFFTATVLVGLLQYTLRRRASEADQGQWFDLSIVFAISVIVVWYLVLLPASRGSTLSAFRTLAVTAYPVLGCLVAFAALAQATVARTSSSRLSFRLLAVALTFAFVADLLASPVAFHNPALWLSGLRSVLWAVGIVFLTASAIVAERQRDESSERAETPARRSLSLAPYVSISVIGAALVWVVLPQWRQPVGGLAIGSVCLTMIVLGRQWRITRENQQLAASQETLEAQLRHAQRMEAVGRLAGGIAHDFNNILAVIRLAGQSLRNDVARDRALAAEDVGDIEAAVERGVSLTRQLLAFSRRQVLVAQPVDVTHLVRDAEGMLRRLLLSDIRLEVLAPAPVIVRADRGQLEQILLNLVVNSRDAMPSGGTVRVSVTEVHLDARNPTRPLTLGAGRYAELVVSDSGMGMDELTLQRAFDPFFTTKAPGAGSGLGLSTVYAIATQLGGTVQLVSTPGAGTSVTVFLPCTDEHPAATDARDADAIRGHGERVLVVDDEAAIARATARMLDHLGYVAACAFSATDAIKALESRAAEAQPVDLLLTDMIMGDMSGRELITMVHARWPDVRVACMSGHTEDLVLQGRHGGEREAFLQKPFTLDALAATVRAALDTQAVAQQRV